MDARGRWKYDKRVLDIYIDCLIPFPDAKVASTLCIRGPVKYAVKEKFSNLINDNLILQFTGSNITNLSPRQVALVLVPVILSASFDKEISKIVQPNLIDRIKRQVYLSDVRLESGISNPVVTGCKGLLGT